MRSWVSVGGAVEKVFGAGGLHSGGDLFTESDGITCWALYAVGDPFFAVGQADVAGELHSLAVDRRQCADGRVAGRLEPADEGALGVQARMGAGVVEQARARGRPTVTVVTRDDCKRSL